MKITPSKLPGTPPAAPPVPRAAADPGLPAALPIARYAHLSPFAHASPVEPSAGAQIVRGIAMVLDAAAEDGGRGLVAGAGLFGIATAGFSIAQARRRGDRPATADWLALSASAFQLCGASGLLRAHPAAHGVVTAASGLLGLCGEALRELTPSPDTPGAPAPARHWREQLVSGASGVARTPEPGPGSPGHGALGHADRSRSGG